ncbi:four-carbon acid sugar kinase family protein [Pollutimonas sp. H1-120]|uniref:four-carbon acid sugar kinase family protein n=1 Tax=Pollutimonas sp. H1-120 TaxID=3148824 RepID=UPI003B52F250
MTLSAPRLAFYGDDFTGATDTLATVSAAGLRAMLFLRPPTDGQRAAAGALDCLGIAGAARSMRASEQERELDGIGRYFAQLGAAVTHYKTCSTFDSSPDIGSIGTAVGILGRYLNASPFMPIVGGQPNLNRYCVFGNLFAAFRRGEGAYRLDRHPTMSRHPVTPMHESDLRLHLAGQGLENIASIEYPSYDLPPDELDALIDARVAGGARAVLFDVGHDMHLPIVGRAIWLRACRHPVLAVGASGVAQALLAHWRETAGLETESAHGESKLAPPDGPVFVLSGSMSPVTARQVEASVSYQRIAVDADALMAGNSTRIDAVLADVLRAMSQGRHVLAYIAGPSSGMIQPDIPAAALAKACGVFLARVLQSAKPRRMGVAGGDTSSHCVRHLDIWGLSHLAQLDSGVALCGMHSDQSHLTGVEVMLKGGQMGSADVFERLLGR